MKSKIYHIEILLNKRKKFNYILNFSIVLFIFMFIIPISITLIINCWCRIFWIEYLIIFVISLLLGRVLKLRISNIFNNYESIY